MPTEFVLCSHPEVEGTARLPRTALKHLAGWQPVEADAPTHVDEDPTGDPAALTPSSGREQSLPQSDPDTEEL